MKKLLLIFIAIFGLFSSLNAEAIRITSGKESAIKNIDLNIEGEKITALVGHSGAGKSTIMNLIPRFYQQQEGKIFVDDQDIQKVSLSSLRDKISNLKEKLLLA